MNVKSIRLLDLFAGAGGFSWGMHRAGFNPGVLIDHCSEAVETLEANFSQFGAIALQRDLSLYSPQQLKKELRANGHDSDFDLIVGGPPCQGWSQVGRGKLKSLGRKSEGIFSDPRNVLYKRFLEFIGSFKPPVCVMENVPGMLSHSGQNIAEMVADGIRANGYDVTWSLMNAVNYGVPQVRPRLFFVGVRKDLGIKFAFPDCKTESGKRIYPEVTVLDAIGDLPIIRNGARDWIRDYKPARKLSAFGKIMREGADQSKIFDHVCRTQNQQDLEAFKLMKQGGWYRDLPKKYKRYRDDIFEDKYKKLIWKKPSWCVTAHLSRDCYTHIHPSQTRTISVREAARLQSFPDCFYFAGCLGDKYRLIGNAVPPLMAEKIAIALKLQVFDKLTRGKSATKTKKSTLGRTNQPALSAR